MVRKEDRGEGKFDTLTKALRLASYTTDITDNKKVFTPDHEKTTERIVSLAWSIYHRARIANDIRVENADDLMERRKLQNQAIAECDQLLTAIQIAKRVFHLRLKRVKYWGEMVEELKNHLRKWRESDADCFRKKH
nr:MAG TPA: Avd-like-generating retroelement protein [Caudoviricetes sp.]